MDPVVLQVPLDRVVLWHDEEIHVLARGPFHEVAFHALGRHEVHHEGAHVEARDAPWDRPCDEDACPWDPFPLDHHVP